MSDTVNLPAGSSVVYLLDAAVVSGAGERITNTIEATGPNGSVSASDITDMVLFRDGFELGGDGAQGIGGGWLDFGELGSTQDVVLQVKADELGSLQRTILVAAGDGSFRIEAVRISDQVWVRLVARTSTGMSASAWSPLLSEQALIALEGSTVLLAGAANDIALGLEHGGSFSLLQRALGIGYGRASRLIDFMAEDGIVAARNALTA